MNKGGFLIYKCRKCGELIKNSHVPDVFIALVFAQTGRDSSKLWSGGTRIQMIDNHYCDDGCIGVTDLIGAEED